jgi:hypothetical protein
MPPLARCSASTFPAAEHLLDRQQAHIREILGVLSSHVLVGAAQVFSLAHGLGRITAVV